MVHGERYWPLSTSPTKHKITSPFPIVDECDDYVVVDKPPFVQAHPSKPSDVRTLWCGLKDLLSYELVNGGQVSLINRLDRETSGLTLVAKTRTAARSLCRQMEQRSISKAYLAIVWGWPTQDRWTVEAPLLRQGSVTISRIYLKQTVHPTGAPARTRFEVIERLGRVEPGTGRYSVVRCLPETGRMHQLRVHLASSGHPIVGDKIYGPDEGCYLEFIETGWTPSLADRLLLPRHALHAAYLRLEETGKEWHSPLPIDLGEFIRTVNSGRNFAGEGKRPAPINRP
jgi:23S rRNA pseudouridine1911/1915/1917 synthase